SNTERYLPVEGFSGAWIEPSGATTVTESSRIGTWSGWNRVFDTAASTVTQASSPDSTVAEGVIHIRCAWADGAARRAARPSARPAAERRSAMGAILSRV